MKLAIAAAAIAVTACATQPQLTDAELQELASPRCQGAQHCNTMWQRAQLWVVNHSPYKIQIANDVVIQTYTPINSSAQPGFTIARELQGPESYIITTRVTCINPFGCTPNPQRALLSLHRYLRETPK